MSWKELPLSEYKISYLIDILLYIALIYNLKPLLFLGFSSDCRKPRLNFSHCSMNHSLIGCLFIVSTNLLSSIELFSTLKILFLMSNFRLCSSEKILPLHCMASFFVKRLSIMSLVNPITAHNFSIFNISLNIGNHLCAFSSKVFSREISMSLASSS